MRDDGERWVSSKLFFMCVNKLDLNDSVYHIPAGVFMSNEELTYYVDHLQDKLKSSTVTTQEEYEAAEYVSTICSVLKAWARGGHSVTVV